MNRRLKAKIVERFGTQADFAQALGVDEALVSRVVRGRRSLSTENKKLWMRKLNCNLEIFSR